MKLNERSEGNLRGVNPDLVRVVRKCAEITPVDFVVTEGFRSVERQKQLLAEGKSTTMRSRHITGHAIDVAAVVGGKVTWDFREYEKIAAAMKDAAKAEGVHIEWGGDWRSFKDGPHFQLPWADYP